MREVLHYNKMSVRWCRRRVKYGSSYLVVYHLFYMKVTDVSVKEIYK